MRDSFMNQLKRVKAESRNEITLELPTKFAFRHHDRYDFNQCLQFFQWNIKDSYVFIDFTKCVSANYQSSSPLVLYIWTLKQQNCNVDIILNDSNTGAREMWRSMDARGIFNVYTFIQIIIKILDQQ